MHRQLRQDLATAPARRGRQADRQTGVSQAKLGTIKRPDHGTQVTYNGKALYRFASNNKPGAVTGQNVAGFHVIVTNAGSATSATTTTTTSGYGR